MAAEGVFKRGPRCNAGTRGLGWRGPPACRVREAQGMARARKPGQSSASGCRAPRAKRPCFGAGCHPAPGPNDAPARAHSGRTRQARPHGSLPAAGADPAASASGRATRKPRHPGRPQ